ncbi:MAG TPA: hypothetical protein PKM44_05585, partial [Turneriella sp.]|nr:hypothetical protein [Turneriella sp.]
MKKMGFLFGLTAALLIVVCADTRGKKKYIEQIEEERYRQNITFALKPGNLVQIQDQTGSLRPVPLKDSSGAGEGDSIDLNNDGNADIRLTRWNITKITAWSFILQADFDNDGQPDYYVHFRVTGSAVHARILTANSMDSLPLVFLIDGSDQITGLDRTGDGVSDDSVLNGVAVVAPSVVNLPGYSPPAGIFSTSQNVMIATTTV